MQKIAKQIFKEFWIQTTLSIIWATFKMYNSKETNEYISIFIANFSGSLFFLSWMFGQVFRVKKQLKIEEEFGNIKSDLNILIKNLEKQTKDLIGYSTGGDSIAYLRPSYFNSSELHLDLINISEYPVFDFAGEWIDLDENIDPINNIFWTRNNFVIGDIHPNKIAIGCLRFDFSNRSRLRINVFSRCRNRNITQQIRVVKIEDKLIIAYQIKSDNFNKTNVPDNFPGYNPNNIENIFE